MCFSEELRTELIVKESTGSDLASRGHWCRANGLCCLDHEEKDEWFPGDTRYLMDTELHHEPWCWEKEDFLPAKDGGPSVHEIKTRDRLQESRDNCRRAISFMELGYARRG
eukprot:GHVU01041173.1.p2 GENE.GHVU01041173.1~~GHVU01041173.1.p2  ORF type:complete len:111 (-),score=6.67 GHVU01041173.1:1508-1840(-)